MANSLFRTILSPIRQRADDKLTSDLYLLFQQVKLNLIEQIRTHPISQELTNHTNPSKFLAGKGTLFGFMGFHVGDRPVENLIDFINEFTVPVIDKRKGGLLISKINLIIKLPSRDDLRKANLFTEWHGGISWPEMIETGISGLPYFIANSTSDASRSQEGLQSDQILRVKNYSPVPYISEIFSNTRKTIASIKGVAVL